MRLIRRAPWAARRRGKHLNSHAKIAAFFDLDGTLLPPPSLERRFAGFLSWRKQLRGTGVLRWLGAWCWRVWSDPLAATHGNKMYLAGVPAAALEAYRTSLRRLPPLLYTATHTRLLWHAARGHRIIIVSGTLLSLAETALAPLAEELRSAGRAPLRICANALDSARGRLTGRLSGEALAGPAKARAVVQLAAEHALDLAQCFAYANSFHDRHFLFAVGNPVAVRPTALLERLARRRGWPVLAADATRPLGPEGTVESSAVAHPWPKIISC